LTEDIKRTQNAGGESARAEIYFAPVAESVARVAALLPTQPREDVSSLLPPIDVPRVKSFEPTEYLPVASTDWIVTLDLLRPDRISASAVAQLFGSEWRKTYGGMTIYGRDADSGLWTFLVSSESPESISALQFAWPYFPTWSRDGAVTSASMFRRRAIAVEKRVQTLASVRVQTDVDPLSANARSVSLAALSVRFSRTVVLCLKALPGQMFDGRDIWDVMLSLGLRWGDMDWFHWDNPSDFGDRALFSVWTSTEPGYFLPEKIAAGRVKTSDLVFGYSLPRSADPVRVYDAMQIAVEYARKRLGGRVVTDDGRRPDCDAIRRELQQSAAELEAEGFRPGSDAALRFF
jgi:ZipA-like protein with FtsZ-binding domain